MESATRILFFVLSLACIGIAKKGCIRPDIDLHKDCPRVGYDCTLSAVLDSFAAGELDKQQFDSGSSIQCVPGAKLFVQQGEQSKLTCYKKKWRFGARPCDFTETALCARPCENVCSKNLISSAPSDAVAITTKEVTTSYPCTRGFCTTPHTHLVGYLPGSDDPVPVHGLVTCGGDQLWADNDDNHFQYVACVYKDACEDRIPNVTVNNCPVTGYDCSDASYNSFTVNGVGASATLQCNDASATLFVDGEQATVICSQDHWRVDSDTIVHNAVCGKTCTSCRTAVPSYDSSTLAGRYLGNTTAIQTIQPQAGSASCTVATCGSTGDRLIAFANDSSLPVFVDSLFCTGSGMWKDINGNTYEAAGCYTDDKCGICDQNFYYNGFMSAQYPDYSTDANNCPIPDMCINNQLLGYNTTAGANIITTVGSALIQCPPGSNKWLVYTDPKLETPLYYDLLGCPESCPSLTLLSNEDTHVYITQPFTETGHVYTCAGEGMDITDVGPSPNNRLWCSGTQWSDQNNSPFDATAGVGCLTGTVDSCEKVPPAGKTLPDGAKNANVDSSQTMATCDTGYNMMGFKYDHNGDNKASSDYEFISPGTQRLGCIALADTDATPVWAFRSTNTGYRNIFCLPA